MAFPINIQNVFCHRRHLMLPFLTLLFIAVIIFGYSAFFVNKMGILKTDLASTEDLVSCEAKCRTNFRRTEQKLNISYAQPKFDVKKTFQVLDDNLQKCLLLKDEAFQTSTSKIKDDSNDDKEYTMYNTLSSFNKILKSMNVTAVLIEPSILYCMLKQKYQNLLERRKFDVSTFWGSNTIVTYGILGKDIATLQKEEIFYKFKESAFEPYFVQSPLAEWMKSESSHVTLDSFTSHMFYFHKSYTIHLLVFIKRENYLWYFGHQSGGLILPPQDNLLFVNYDGVFEKFSFVPLGMKIENSTEFYIPSDPHYFLFQMMSSRFIECDISRAANVVRKQPGPSTKLSLQGFKERTILAIREIKTVFHPLLINVWVSSGTLLGWYRQCDIIPYTTDVDFCAWAFEVDNLKAITDFLSSNKNLNIVMRMGLLEEALEFHLNCHDLRVDVFFMYPAYNGSWIAVHSPHDGFYIKQHFPHFTLCSAALLGEKIQVPCEAEKLILAEYGPEWKYPVSVWGYLSSIKNKGRLIYWNKSNIKDIYQNF